MYAGWEDEDGVLAWVASPQRVYYDTMTGHLACRCERYQDLGRCRHLVRWRPEVTVCVLEIYL